MSPRRGGAQGPDGLLVVDKPAGMTSHDVVSRVRRLARTRRVGHAGTLDPMATGVLVLGLGRATRLLTHLVGADKEYLATIRLGVSTSTEDAEGAVLARTDAGVVTADAVRAEVAALTGPIQQVPSSVSALRVDGQRAHARVRAGEEVVLPARPVVVHAFDVLALRAAADEGVAALDADVRVTCSSGTYVRALARDVGGALGVGGHLTALRRTRVAAFDLAAARTLAQLEELADQDDLGGALLGLVDAARTAFPVWEVDPEQARRLAHGQRLPSGSLPAGAGAGAGLAAAVVRGPDGEVLVALVADRDGAVRPDLVLAAPEQLAG